MDNNIERVKELRNKYIQLKGKLEEEKAKNDGEIPFGKRFIASIGDFNIIRELDKLTDEELINHYEIEEIEHLIATIDGYYESAKGNDKFEFSLKTNIQINDFIKGKEGSYEELVQALYMTIFQRYNDDIKKEENYEVTTEFADKVYRFSNEGPHPEVNYRKTSEKDIGSVYMTEEEYEHILSVNNANYETQKERIMAIKKEMVKYILPNIRNRMMHGDFNNKIDREGNKIVEISPCGFKAKFFFDCIVEFYEAVAKEIESRIDKEDILFDFEKILLDKESANKSIVNDKDKVMKLILPLYVNSFITYNFKQKYAYDKTRKKFANEENSESKLEFLDEYYKKGKNDSFVYKVAEYNRKNLKKEYTAYEIFEHFRNSVVHNNFECEDGKIYLKDYNQEGKETARFVIPYEMIEELIEKQSEHAKKYFEKGFQGNPGDNHDEATNIDTNEMEI